MTLLKIATSVGRLIILKTNLEYACSILKDEQQVEATELLMDVDRLLAMEVDRVDRVDKADEADEDTSIEKAITFIEEHEAKISHLNEAALLEEYMATEAMEATETTETE